MRYAAILCTVLLLAQTAQAQDPKVKGVQFGPFTTWMTPQEAMAAAPGLSWEKELDRQTRELREAKAPDAVEFLGQRWDLHVGSIVNEKSFVLNRSFEFSNMSECAAAFKEMIAALEPIYGLFGQHPAFPVLKQTLYVDEPFQLETLKSGSRYRAYNSLPEVLDVVSVNETDIDKGEAVFIEGYGLPGAKFCDLTITVFRDARRPRYAKAAMPKAGH